MSTYQRRICEPFFRPFQIEVGVPKRRILMSLGEDPGLLLADSAVPNLLSLERARGGRGDGIERCSSRVGMCVSK